MVNLHQKYKNKKESNSSPWPTEEEQEELSGSEFLLTIAGMFETHSSDTSENVKNHIADVVKRKYSYQ